MQVMALRDKRSRRLHNSTFTSDQSDRVLVSQSGPKNTSELEKGGNPSNARMFFGTELKEHTKDKALEYLLNG